ncbi:MAG: hypothetical protein AAGE59_04970 [Cyanobacteria bacterium P01_F01_bin.86]
MSYGEFTFQKIETDLQIQLEEDDLYSLIEPVEINSFFAEIMRENVPLALSINTEKARSELIVAPVLVELRKRLNHQISLFSGIEFNVDNRRGLNGVCDFIISASSRQILISAPIINIVEAKNENIKSGIPQCIATMYAAYLFNQSKEIVVPYVFGVVTTGSSWKFMRLEGQKVVVDSMEYFIDSVEKIMGILIHMTNTREI